jgi:hypothetical protein
VKEAEPQVQPAPEPVLEAEPLVADDNSEDNSEDMAPVVGRARR